MNAQSDRLREARIKAGFTSAAKAAEALGVAPSTYRAHENGQNDFDLDQARIYGKRLGIDPFWLMAGVEQSDTYKTGIRSRSHDPAAPEADLSEVDQVDGFSVLEIDIRAGAGAGGFEVVPSNSMHHGFSVSADAVRDRWRLPDSFTRGELRMEPSGAYIVEIYGDSGYDPNNPHAPGSVHAGDRVIVDSNDRRPSPPGLFAIHDGMGVVVKLVEFLPRSDPPRLRLLSRNPLYDSYEVVEGEAVIIGRVRGRISSI